MNLEFNFNYEKEYIDFKSKEEWKKYVSNEYDLLTLNDRLNYLKYFLTKPKDKGHYIFKVDGVDFNSNPIEIFGAKFYNPKKEKILSFYKTSDSILAEERDKYFTKTELFYSEREIFQELLVKGSNCNVIIPIEYFVEDMGYFNFFGSPVKSFIEAFNRAQLSLLEFRRYLKHYTVEPFRNEISSSINISGKCILTDSELNFHTASNDRGNEEVVFKTDEIREKMIQESLNYKQRIKAQNIFFEHIANSNALISSYDLENHKFSFKSLWIECFEPYFKDIDDIIFYVKKSVLIRTNFFSNYRILLSNALSFRMELTNHSSFLEDNFMYQTGINDLGIGEIIDGSKLEKNFESLPNDSLLLEMKEEMRSFITDEDKFFKLIDNWVTEIIRIAYDERNIEVHYNLMNYYNDVSIKKDLLFMTSCVIGTFNDAIFKNDIESVVSAKSYIEDVYSESKL